MKTLKDFVSPQIEEPDNIQEGEILSLEDYPKLLGENGENHPMDPPAMLIMRRKSIRQFPNGQRVALYYVDKINKYVTVPYNSMQWSVAVEEETVIDKLNTILENNTTDLIVFEDGTKSKVSVNTAKSILEMYNQLNAQNKEMVLEMTKTKDEFNKIINFAQSYK